MNFIENESNLYHDKMPQKNMSDLIVTIFVKFYLQI